MGLVLSFFIILILILGIIFLKVKITANSLDFELFRKDLRKSEYDIRIGLYFLGLIKILNIRIRNGVIEYIFVKLDINKIIKSKLYIDKIKPKFDNITKKKMMENLKKTRFKLENFKFNLKLGTDSIVVTSMLVGIISGIISYSMQTYIEKYNKENYYWRVLPNFEENLFVKLSASLKLSYSPFLSKIVKRLQFIN